MHHASTLVIAALALAAVAFAIGAAPRNQDAKPAAPAASTPAALKYKMKDIDGKDVDLAQYAGSVVVMVNVASKCGYTKQYADLQAIFDKYKEQGLVVLGFPANEFGEQEPGSNEEIKSFCTSTYSVTFPMFAKVIVKGDGTCDLYKFLTSTDTDPKFAGEIKWNFTKFLIGRNGEVVARYEPKVKPTSEEMTKAIEAELAKK